MAVADRYVRLGTPVPEIYPGTLAYLKQAMKDVQLASYRFSGEHFLEAVYEGQRVTLQVYKDGKCTWAARKS